jgi:hypothetical protein
LLAAPAKPSGIDQKLGHSLSSSFHGFEGSPCNGAAELPAFSAARMTPRSKQPKRIQLKWLDDVLNALSKRASLPPHSWAIVYYICSAALDAPLGAGFHCDGADELMSCKERTHCELG